jgi:hypothetical protein
VDLITTGIIAVLFLGLLILQWQVKPRLIKIKQGTALVRRRPKSLPDGGTRAFFTSPYVIKLADKYEIVDVTTRRFRYDLSGRTKDDRDFTIKGELSLRLPRESDNLLEALDEFGAELLGQHDLLKERFEADFANATRKVASSIEADKWPSRLDGFRVAVIEMLGTYQHGFHADAAFIDLQV